MLLHRWDRAGRRVFTPRDLGRLLGGAPGRALELRLQRMVDRGVLIRAARGVYALAESSQPKTSLIEEVAVALRPAEWSYISLESALSEHGWISQIPVGRITVMTTGRSGSFTTPWGVIEFTHTTRDPSEILEATVDTGRPLRLARAATALRDLRRVGRNLHLVVPPDGDPIREPDTQGPSI